MSRPQTPSALPIHNVTPSDDSRSASPAHVAVRSTKASSITSTYSKLSPEDTAARLTTSVAQGLQNGEAARRLIQHGSNELPSEEPEPLWLRFAKQFKETLILLLLGSALISFMLGNIDDAISIGLAVTIVVTVAFVQEYRSEKSLEALNRLVPHYANIVRQADSDGTYINGGINGDVGKDGLEMEELSQKTSTTTGRLSTTMQASQLVPGDLVLFSTGDRIPADIRITKATDLAIDESNLTGENEAVLKQEAALFPPARNRQVQTSKLNPDYAVNAAGTVGADLRLTEQLNIAFMGTLVRTGYGEGIVIATGGDTEFGAISASLQEIESPRTPLQLTMDRLGQELSYISFGVIALIVVIGLIQGMKLLDMFTIGVSLAVAAIPEGLPIIVTVTLALGVLRMAKQGAIVRKLPSVETLGSVNVVCSDKTGTLTLNHMTVTKMWHSDAGEPFDMTREMSAVHQDTATRTIVRIGNIANNSRLAKQNPTTPATAASAAVLSSTTGLDGAIGSRWVGQPTDVAMLDLVDMFGEEDVRERLGERHAETPFSSGRKWMGVLIGGQNSEVAYMKGALEQVLSRCDSYLTKDGREMPLDESRRKTAIAASEQMAEDGLRVLGFASGAVSRRAAQHPAGHTIPQSQAGRRRSSVVQDESVFRGLVFAGLVGMNDPPRPGVDKSIKTLVAGGVKVIMITGDAETTAVAIARKLGIPLGTGLASGTDASSSVLRGDQLDKMTDDELAAAMSGTSIFARTSPEHKMKIIRALQSRGCVVAMTGDGVNDAPALKKADIGISMGKLGTDVAKEAADMILTDDDFSTILSAIEEGKGIFYNIQNFITFQLSTSVAALSLVLLATTFHLKNPLNAMQILWINILMDGPPAQSLGVEPVDPSVMKREVRPRNARALTAPVIRRVATSAGIIMLGTLMVYVREMAADGMVTARDTTMTFTCFVFFDMFNALTCRSADKSVARGEIALWGNRMFNVAVGGSILGQLAVIYLPFLQRIFQTEGLYLSDLFFLLSIASTVFWVDEAKKYWRTQRTRPYGGYSGSV